MLMLNVTGAPGPYARVRAADGQWKARPGPLDVLLAFCKCGDRSTTGPSKGTTMTSMFVNLPVTDLERAKAFYTALGFTHQPALHRPQLGLRRRRGGPQLLHDPGPRVLPDLDRPADRRPGRQPLRRRPRSSSTPARPSTRRSPTASLPAARSLARPPTTASCTSAGSPTPTATSSTSAGWTRSPPAGPGGVRRPAGLRSMAARDYGQYCGITRALELVGERWALLIVRDLLVGPRRYGELAAGLPRIPTNILAARLKELQEAGVLRRVPQSRVIVYELTPYGRELEPVVLALGAWGFKAMGDPRDEQVITPDSMTMALRTAFRAQVAAGLPATAYAARFGPAELLIRVDGADPGREPRGRAGRPRLRCRSGYPPDHLRRARAGPGDRDRCGRGAARARRAARAGSRARSTWPPEPQPSRPSRVTGHAAGRGRAAAGQCARADPDQGARGRRRLRGDLRCNPRRRRLPDLLAGPAGEAPPAQGRDRRVGGGRRRHPRRPGRRPGGAAPGRRRTGPRVGPEATGCRPTGSPCRPGCWSTPTAAVAASGALWSGPRPRGAARTGRRAGARRPAEHHRPAALYASEGWTRLGPTTLDLGHLGHGDVPPLQLWVYLAPEQV